MFLTCLNAESRNDQIWYLDSGCSSHMTNDRELFVKIDEKFSNFVILGDGKSERVEGKGVIAVQSRSGEQKFIHDVLYVPTLAHNLLSVGQLIQKGYRVVFEENKYRVVDKKN